MKPPVEVLVQEADFDPGALQHALLSGRHEEGALATFTGYVRANNDNRGVSRMLLEHYPGMTEKSIEATLGEAAQRWAIGSAMALHRVGELIPGDRIVWVGVTSSHRAEAFAACEFIMDYLKTDAVFWKKEQGEQGTRWIESTAEDHQRQQQWSGNPAHGLGGQE